MTTLFISHSSRDRSWADEVHERLQDQGYTALFLDSHPDDGIVAGADWERTLYRRLRQSRGLVILCTADWLTSPWCVAEAMMARERGKPLFLLAARDVIDGRQLKVSAPAAPALAIPDFLKDTQFIPLATLTKDQAYQRLNEALRKVLRPQEVFAPPERPYPGLDPFQEKDASVFFGRDDDIQRVENVLTQRRRNNARGFLLVLGASGCGKSSLVRAGVVPRLKRPPIESGSGAGWVVPPPMRAGRGLDGLALALVQASKETGQPLPLNDVLHQLERARKPVGLEGGVRALREITNALLAARGSAVDHVSLVVDQLEEVFATEEGSGARAALMVLLGCCAEEGSPLVVLATMRSDFLNAFQLFPDAAERYEEITLDPMPPSRFGEVIMGPADRFGLRLQPGLAERLIADTGYDDALPLLAFTLERLYASSGADGELALEAYERLFPEVRVNDSRGAPHTYRGVSAAIKHVADKILEEKGYARLSAEEPRTRDLRFAFCSLARIGEEGQFTRRIGRWSLMAPSCRPVLDEFIRQRLLVSWNDDNAERRLRVAHEVLFRVWPTLRDWLEKETESMRLLESVERAAQDWSEKDPKPPDLLVHLGSRLETVDQLVEGNRQQMLSDLAKHYLDACRTKQNRRRRARRGIIGLVLAILASSTVIFSYLWSSAEAQRAIAQHNLELSEVNESLYLARRSAEQLRDGRIEDSLLLALHALPSTSRPDRPHVPEAEAQLYRALSAFRQKAELNAHTAAVWSASFSPDYSRIVTASDDGSAIFWRIDGPDRVSVVKKLDDHAGPVLQASFSNDGRYVLTSSTDGTARIWDSEDDGHKILRGHTAPVVGAAFRPFSSASSGPLEVATASWDGTMRLWNATSGELEGHPIVLDGSPLTHVEFDRSGRLVVMTSLAGTATIADLETGDHRRLLDRTAGAVWHAAFSPDGTRIVIASEGAEDRIANPALGTTERRTALHVFDVESGRLLRLLNGHEKGVLHAEFDGTGELIVSASRDGTAIVWDSGSGRQIRKLVGHEDAVLTAAFSHRGERIVTASRDGTARVFDAGSGQQKAIQRHDGAVLTAAFDRDSRYILTASMDGIMALVAVEPGRQLRVLRGHQGPVGHAEFGPAELGGHTLAVTASEDETVGGPPMPSDMTARIWDPKTGEQLAALKHTDEVLAATFSKDGRWLATGSGDGSVRVWDVAGDPTRPKPVFAFLHQTGPVRHIAFSQDGRLLLVGSAEAAHMYDLTTGEEKTLLPGPHGQLDGAVTAVAFSPPAGDILVVASEGGAFWLWRRLADGGPDLVKSAKQDEGVTAAAFGLPLQSQEPLLATASATGEVNLWNPSTGGHIGKLEGRHNGLIHAVDFSPDGRLLVTASEDQTALIWHAEDRQQLRVLQGHEAALPHAEFAPQKNPDGSHRVLTTSWDGTIRLWEATSGELLTEIQGHTMGIQHAEFSPDGRTILSASWDQTARIWEVMEQGSALIQNACSVVMANRLALDQQKRRNFSIPENQIICFQD